MLYNMSVMVLGTEQLNLVEEQLEIKILSFSDLWMLFSDWLVQKERWDSF